MTGREFFRRTKRIIDMLVWADSFLPKKLNRLFFAMLAPFEGRGFIVLRYILIRNLAVSCGENVAVFHNVFINFGESGREGLRFGKNVSVNTGCYIDASGGISIGDNVSIAHQTSILSTNHTWTDPNVPICYNEVASRPVRIEDDVWIGCGCRILSGVTIHSRSVVAAGAVVCRNVEFNTVVGGVPAKFLKNI